MAKMNPADLVDAAFGEAARGRIAAPRGDVERALSTSHARSSSPSAIDFLRRATRPCTCHMGACCSWPAGRDEAAAAYERAIAVTRAKGATAWKAQIERLLAEL